MNHLKNNYDIQNIGDTFRIAFAQKKASGQTMEENAESACLLMEKAKEMGADILLLPEVFLSGYVLPVKKDHILKKEDGYLRNFCEKAEALSMGVVLTAFTEGEEKPRNSAFLIDKKGRIIFQYDKVHTCDFSDEACLESGKAFYTGDFHSVNLGIMICYDREYPESARMLMLKGAEIILVPNDCSSMKPRLQALSTRAYENMTGVVMANPPGKNAGCSCAFSPICWDKEGNCVENTMFIAGEEDEGVFFVDFSMEELRQYRSSEMMGNTFRKPKAYKELLEEMVSEPFIRERGGE